MSKVTNLNQFRKRKARGDAKQRADENAVKFGRSKAERELEAERKAREKAHLDGHERDT